VQTDAEYEAALLKDIPNPVLPAETAELLAKFAEDWPETQVALEAHTAHATAQTEAKFARLLHSVVRSLYQDIAPIAHSYAQTESNQFRATVLEAHVDYDAVYPKLEPWINKQPAYLQSGMREAYNSGSAQDVIDMVTRFKKESGVVDTTPPAPTEGDASGRKATVLTPVPSRRTTPKPSGEDPNDYDGAFAEASTNY
jgi:hypothetical protein